MHPIASKINVTPKGVYLPILKLHSILLANNNKFVTTVKFHNRVLQLTAVFWKSDTFVVTFILLVIVPWAHISLENFNRKGISSEKINYLTGSSLL